MDYDKFFKNEYLYLILTYVICGPGKIRFAKTVFNALKLLSNSLYPLLKPFLRE